MAGEYFPVLFLLPEQAGFNPPALAGYGPVSSHRNMALSNRIDVFQFNNPVPQ